MGFMMAGPGCCCCNDIYAGRATFFELSRINGDDAKLAKSHTAPSTSQIGLFDVDYVNSRIYIQSTSTNTIESIKAKDLTDRQVLVTHTSDISIIRGVCVHPWNSHVFYGANDRDSPFKERYIRRIDLDGTNDQTIVTHSPAVTTGATVEGMDVSKEDEFVFYQLAWVYATTGNAPEVRRCNADGTGDTSLWTVADPSTDGFATPSLCVDNTNERIYWVASSTAIATTGRYKLWRCDFDGSNPTEIYVAAQRVDSHSLSNIRLIGWSHETERVYFYLYSSDGFTSTFTANDDSGVYSCDADGGDVQPVAINEHWSDGSTTNGEPRSDMVFWKLGCGFEKFGASAKA